MKEWIKIRKDEIISLEQELNELKKNGYVLSDWLVDIYGRKINKNFEKDISLARVKVSDINIKKPIKLSELYNEFNEHGLGLVDPQTALYIRRLYLDQPKGEWLRIAVPFDSMIDSDGVPHLPKLGFALNKYYMETYWAWPDAIFHPHNEFVVSIKIN
jgi:hypothetical protein